ncbi:MAG TPA: hypothetical protein VFG05_11045 [Methylocella sp.]|nr:hypothetical protein [Methylocella sp.]
MTRWAKHAFWPVLVFFWASPAASQQRAENGAKQPYEIVRSIQALQDQLVLGNASARNKLPKIIEQLDETLLAANREAWRDSRNARAAVVFMLSGGSPRVAQKIIEAGVSGPADIVLLQGALAYVQGRNTEAKRILQPIDPTSLPPLAGAHIAVTQAALIARDDPRAAIRLLDVARVLAPGTLVEETALRRALVLADEMSDVDQFVRLADEYVWRFPKSMYFETFRQRFSSAALRFCFAAGRLDYSKIENIVSKLDLAGQLDLYLHIARKAVIDGKMDVARFAAAKATDLSKEGTSERAGSMLYEAAALILTGQHQPGLAKLNSIDQSALPKQDAELREAIALMAARIEEQPRKLRANDAAELETRRSTLPAAANASDSASALIGLVEQRLSLAKEVLERSGP